MKPVNGYVIVEKTETPEGGLYVPDEGEVALYTMNNSGIYCMQRDLIQLPDGRFAIKEDKIIARTENA